MSSPQTRKLNRDYPGYRTASQVDAMIRRPAGTVERWRRNGTLRPSMTARSGEVIVYLFGPDAVNEARRLCKTLRPGPKKESSR